MARSCLTRPPAVDHLLPEDWLGVTFLLYTIVAFCADQQTSCSITKHAN